MSNQEHMQFQTEVGKLLHLVTNFLYSNPDIFLRELIANAVDAVQKFNYLVLSESDKYKKEHEDEADLKIYVTYDKTAKTITVSDNGVGMTKDEAISNLGTIAKSGTKEFLNSITGDKLRDNDLIGQFGVGFYSAFIVADKVTVRSRKAAADYADGVLWESNGQGEFTVETIYKEKRGTDVILHLKADKEEYLNDWKLKNIILKYSDYINLPILMKKPAQSKDTTSKTEDQGMDVIDAEKINNTNQNDSGIDENSEKTSVVTSDADEYEVVNHVVALWTLPKNQITEDQYKAFYKHVSHEYDDALSHVHARIEGASEYTILLYLPAKAPFDLWQQEQTSGLKLYIRRVYIMDNVDQFLPKYLRFIKGIVDAYDLPLNVSREILQSSKQAEAMKQTITKRTLNMLDSLANNEKDKYDQFWDQFGQVLKEGIAEDKQNTDQIANLFRFATTHDDIQKQRVSLADYISRMKPDQKKIYYIIADTFTAAKNSPHLEIFRKNDVEVLLMSDRIDEWLVIHLREFSGKQLQSVMSGELDLFGLSDSSKTDKSGDSDSLDNKNKDNDADSNAEKSISNEDKKELEAIKNVLKDKVNDVRFSNRLTQSPSCLIGEDNALSMHMQRLLKNVGHDFPNTKPILEINRDHDLVKKLLSEDNSEAFENISCLLYEQALIAEGGHLDDPAGFVARINKVISYMTERSNPAVTQKIKNNTSSDSLDSNS